MIVDKKQDRNNEVPAIEFLKKIGMDFPEVIEVVKNYQ
jgi:hypothetical protein